MSRAHVLGACATLLFAFSIGCGNESPTTPTPAFTVDVWEGPNYTAPFDGFWLVQSLTLPVQGTPTTVVRGGTTTSVRADATFEALTNSTAVVHARTVMLVDGVPATEIAFHTIRATVTDRHWTFEDEFKQTDVYFYDVVGDTVTLDYDASDLRNTGIDPPTQIVLQKTAPFSQLLVGRWVLNWMEQAGQTVTAGGACIETSPGVQWTTLKMEIAIDRWLLLEQQFQQIQYSDSACTAETGRMEATSDGYAEEINKQTAKFWVRHDTGPEFVEFTIGANGDVVTLTRTDCLLQPNCETEVPTVVEVARARKL